MLLAGCAQNMLLESDRPKDRPGTNAPAAPSSSSKDPVFDDLKTGWTRLPPPPEVRSVAATDWTGEHLVIWGGYVYTGYSDEVPEADGFIFDAREGTWEQMAPSPLGPRAVPASEWTGNELLIWGGWDNGSDSIVGFLDDGAAYDPTTDSWRRLPPAPLSARAPLSVWTGQEFIVWGTHVRVNKPPRDGAAYDPLANTWRPIADAPIDLTDATAAWTGREMIVFGAALHGGNDSETPTAIGAAYNPTTDTWRRLPDSQLSPQASTASWNGRELIAWDYLNGSAAYDPRTDEWRKLPPVPLDDYECSPESISLDGHFFGNYCGSLIVYDPADGRWHDVSRREVVGWGVEIVAAGRVILLLARDVGTKEKAMFAYRPPTW